MMIPQSIFITYLTIVISIFSFISEANASKSGTIGFTTDLIHRDSPQSPYHDPSLSPSQRLANSIRRSYDRLNHLSVKCNKASPVTDVTAYGGEYLMNYLIGTPPVISLGIADTGSNLLWTQCAPCTSCIKQRYPLFHPNKSQTYKTVPCSSSSCSTMSDGFCDRSDKTCIYSIMYGDGSTTEGDLATDTLTLGSTIGELLSFPNFTFGCGSNTRGIFSGAESGIVGLGRGDSSLVSQLGSSIQGKFAYCFVPENDPNATTSSSKIHFGKNAGISGGDVVSTPLVATEDDSFYHLILEGISVGNQRFEVLNNSVQANDMIIDSGTTITFIPDELYRRVETALVNVVKLKRVVNPEGELKLCWFTKTNAGFPRITVHFKGADVVLNTENAFLNISNDSMCFAFESDRGNLAIYGNLAQTNFLVAYDLQNKKLSFKSKDCTKP